MNARDRHCMWRPRNINTKAVQNKQTARWESSEESSISSSTSSDSSEETSDDELTIDVIRAGNIDQELDEKDEEMVQNPRPSKIQKINPDSSNLSLLKLSQSN